MRIGALSLFERTNSKWLFNIAAWHSRHSLTWSWIAAVSFDRVWRKPSGGLRIGFSRVRHNGGGQLYFVLPFVVFHTSRQHEMWFRDMYARARDREDALERQVSKLRRDLTLARATAMVGSEGGRPN